MGGARPIYIPSTFMVTFQNISQVQTRGNYTERQKNPICFHYCVNWTSRSHLAVSVVYWYDACLVIRRSWFDSYPSPPVMFFHSGSNMHWALRVYVEIRQKLFIYHSSSNMHWAFSVYVEIRQKLFIYHSGSNMHWAFSVYVEIRQQSFNRNLPLP